MYLEVVNALTLSDTFLFVRVLVLLYLRILGNEIFFFFLSPYLVSMDFGLLTDYSYSTIICIDSVKTLPSFSMM